MTSVGEKHGLPYTACIKFRFKELEKSFARPFYNLILFQRCLEHTNQVITC